MTAAKFVNDACNSYHCDGGLVKALQEEEQLLENALLVSAPQLRGTRFEPGYVVCAGCRFK